MMTKLPNPIITLFLVNSLLVPKSFATQLPPLENQFGDVVAHEPGGQAAPGVGLEYATQQDHQTIIHLLGQNQNLAATLQQIQQTLTQSQAQLAATQQALAQSQAQNQNQAATLQQIQQDFAQRDAQLATANQVLAQSQAQNQNQAAKLQEIQELSRGIIMLGASYGVGVIAHRICGLCQDDD